MKIAGLVIVYHPDIHKLCENITTYVKGLDLLYIYDNTESEITGLNEALSKLDTRIQYRYFNSNEGIASRLNTAVKETIEKKYDYLLTMDQDSSFKPGDFDKYKSFIQATTYKNVVQFGVNCQPNFTPPNEQPEEVLTLITSGTILNLSIINNIGVFNEDLYIDFVDAEFSYRVVQKGYVNLMFTNLVLNHSLGTLIQGRSLVTFKKSLRITHAPIRVYYIIRNGLYLLFKSKGMNAMMRKDVLRCIKILKNDLIYNPKLGQVYSNLFLGILAFLTNKMGKK